MARPLALVTGASSGIGAEIARDLAQRGHDLILVARRSAAMEALATELRQAHGVECTVLAQDLAAHGGVAALVAQLRDRSLQPEVLINNAGLGHIGEHARSDWADQQNMIDLNVKALTELTHALLPAMVQRRSGKILNVASTASFQPGPGMAVYFATKAFVLSYSESAAPGAQALGASRSRPCAPARPTASSSRWLPKPSASHWPIAFHLPPQPAWPATAWPR